MVPLKNSRKKHSTGRHLSIEDRRLREEVKSAIADEIPRGHVEHRNKDSRAKKRMAERFFKEGSVWYKDPRDPTGTPVRITTQEELSKRIGNATLETA